MPSDQPQMMNGYSPRHQPPRRPPPSEQARSQGEPPAWMDDVPAWGEAPGTASTRTARRRLTATSAAAIEVQSQRQYFLKGWLNRGDFVLIYGQAGCGKSLFVADLAYRLAQRCESIHGKRAKGGPILYVCLEGQGGFRTRLAALAEHHGPAPDFYLCDGPLDLQNPADVDDLVRLVIGVKAIAVVLDTWAQACPGAEEAGSADNGRALSGINRVRRETGAAVLVVDHTGWGEGDAQKRPRGWSGKWAAADAGLHVDGDIKEGDVQVVPRRLKDGSGFDAIAFGSERVELGEDDDGDPIISFVAVERERVSTQSSNGAQSARTTKSGRTFSDAFSEALADHGVDHNVLGDRTLVKAVNVRFVRDEFLRRYPAERESSDRALRRFLNNLPAEYGSENVNDEVYVWRVWP